MGNRQHVKQIKVFSFFLFYEEKINPCSYNHENDLVEIKTFIMQEKEGRLAGAMFWSKLETVGFRLLVKGLTLGRSIGI